MRPIWSMALLMAALPAAAGAADIEGTGAPSIPSSASRRNARQQGSRAK